MTDAITFFAGIVFVIGIFTLLDWLGRRRARR